jgi:hypothetical protein
MRGIKRIVLDGLWGWRCSTVPCNLGICENLDEQWLSNRYTESALKEYEEQVRGFAYSATSDAALFPGLEKST